MVSKPEPRRIVNIASYEKPTLQKKLSTYAADENRYQWNISKKNCSDIDLSNYFGEYKGSFVLYDLKNDTWTIHDMERNPIPF